MNTIPKPGKDLFTKYFKRYAEAEVNLLNGFASALSHVRSAVSNTRSDLTTKSASKHVPAAHLKEQRGPYWQHSLVIPAYAENLQQLQDVALNCRCSMGQVLQIWVVNCPDNADPELVRQTRDCFQDIIANSRGLAISNNLQLRQFDWGHRDRGQVLLVDRCNEGFQLNSRVGVGGARKIGGDIALKLYEMGWVNSAWCGFTDADVILPGDYFERLQNIPLHAAAAVFPHAHGPLGDSLQQQVIANYQRKLDLHVAGLREAGSPYAFHSIGSTIACHLENYLKVRGVPPRPAGEDFYFLNKLAKTGHIEQLTGNPILLSGRRSLRVPFGTGPAINRALAQGSPVISGYNPAIYQLLSVLLSSLPEFWRQKDQLETAVIIVCRKINTVLQALGYSLPQDMARRCTHQVALTESLGEMLMKSTSEEIFQRHFHCWFDGFRTLKFIHWWRDHGLPNQPV